MDDTIDDLLTALRGQTPEQIEQLITLSDIASHVDDPRLLATYIAALAHDEPTPRVPPAALVDSQPLPPPLSPDTRIIPR